MVKLRQYMQLPFADQLKARYLHVAPKSYALLQAHLKPSKAVQRKVGRLKATPEATVINHLTVMAEQQRQQRDRRKELAKARRHPPFVVDHWPQGHVASPLVVPQGMPALYVSAAVAPSGDLVVAVLTILPGDRVLQTVMNKRLYANHWQEHGLVLPAALPEQELPRLLRSLVLHQDPPAPVMFFKADGHRRVGWAPYLLAIQERLATQKGRVNIYVDVPQALRVAPLHRQARAVLNLRADRLHQPHPILAYVDRTRSLGLQAAYLVAYVMANIPQAKTRSARVRRVYRHGDQLAHAE